MSADEQRESKDRPRVNDIPCPFLAAAFNSGDLNPAEDGTLHVDSLQAELERMGFDDGIVEKVARGAIEKTGESEHDLNLFALRDSALDHSGSTGIRDPKVDPDKVPALLAFGKDGRMYLKHFAAAANHFWMNDPGLSGTMVQGVEMTVLVLLFGREDKNGDLYLTDDDVRALWVEARYPDDWTPRPERSISTREVLKKTAKMMFLRATV